MVYICSRFHLSGTDINHLRRDVHCGIRGCYIWKSVFFSFTTKIPNLSSPKGQEGFPVCLARLWAWRSWKTVESSPRPYDHRSIFMVIAIVIVIAIAIAIVNINIITLVIIMTISGLIYCAGQAMLVYRSCRCCRRIWNKVFIRALPSKSSQLPSKSKPLPTS